MFYELFQIDLQESLFLNLEHKDTFFYVMNNEVAEKVGSKFRLTYYKSSGFRDKELQGRVKDFLDFLRSQKKVIQRQKSNSQHNVKMEDFAELQLLRLDDKLSRFADQINN